MDIGAAILIFIGVIAITALLFGGWIIYLLARALGAVLGGILRLIGVFPARSSGTGPIVRVVGRVTCDRERCRASNPSDARFCRRCGRMLAGESARRISARRAAVL